MPATSIATARDDILATFKAAWDAQDSPPPVAYDDRTEDLPPKDGTAWARVSVRHGDGGGQRTLGEAGTRLFERVGTVFVSIFTPFGGGLVGADGYVEVAMGAFEGVTTASQGVVFRNVRSREVGRSDKWFQTNVLADFEYDIRK